MYGTLLGLGRPAPTRTVVDVNHDTNKKTWYTRFSCGHVVPDDKPMLPGTAKTCPKCLMEMQEA